MAHRAGNSAGSLHEARTAGAHVIEADLHLYRGRVEVRHLKTLGPLPIFWDRWQIANPFAPRMLLNELLLVAQDDVELMLDLKGRSPRLARMVLEQIEPLLARGVSVTICARAWPLLDTFCDVKGVHAVHSVGSARQLRRLLRGARGRRLAGISIHERLLDPVTARRLADEVDVVMTWPVNTAERARELLVCGVQGLISDQPGMVLAAAAVTGRT